MVRPTLLVPIYDHGDAVGDVIRGLAAADLPCLVVDDGSHAPTRAVLARLAAEHAFVEVHRIEHGGKGAALKAGYRHAAARGFTHAIQLDADGQHDAKDVPRFLEIIAADPEALVLGTPVFDSSVPKSRLAARQLSRGLVWLATLSFAIRDPLVGFRGIPLAPTLAILDRVATGNHMEFDPELVVRLHWDGVPVRSLRTVVVYHPGGISHFDVVRDYTRLTGLYVRLVAGMLPRAPELLRRPPPPAGGAPSDERR